MFRFCSRFCCVFKLFLPETYTIILSCLDSVYRLGQEPPGTTEEKLIYAKKLYESAFHPDSGELQNVMGRMSFQVPGGMALTGALLAFYR